MRRRPAEMQSAFIRGGIDQPPLDARKRNSGVGVRGIGSAVGSIGDRRLGVGRGRVTRHEEGAEHRIGTGARGGHETFGIGAAIAGGAVSGAPVEGKTVRQLRIKRVAHKK